MTEIYVQNLRALEREALVCPRAQRELDKLTIDLDFTSGAQERVDYERRESAPVIASVSEAQDLFRSDPLFRMTPATGKRERRNSMSGPQRHEPMMHESLSHMLGGSGRERSLFSMNETHKEADMGVVESEFGDDDEWDEQAFDDEFGGNMMYDLSRAPSRDQNTRRRASE